jgi:ABC-type antimicrobial peptide transport system permease subunit
VISTALARLERRRDLQTLVAVGAAPSMSWRMALTQGAVIASIGTVLGTAVGFVAPAAFVTAANRNRSGAPSDPKMPLAVPWPALILLIVLVTVVAAALSAAFGRPGHGSAGPGQEPLPVG